VTIRHLIYTQGIRFSFLLGLDSGDNPRTVVFG
jgi:hypothetical protein